MWHISCTASSITNNPITQKIVRSRFTTQAFSPIITSITPTTHVMYCPSPAITMSMQTFLCSHNLLLELRLLLVERLQVVKVLNLNINTSYWSGWEYERDRQIRGAKELCES